MTPDPDYTPVVTRLPEALQEEAEAIAEAEAAQRKAEEARVAQADKDAAAKAEQDAAKESAAHDADIERLQRESQ
jgi:hypothetical protein